ncbi:MAG: transporter substrate-binding domain-containing protein [Rhodobacteraceae bacterium]|nr:MAG: transporter substrate-binding domain-containing protein [Paracoccaceae bacterium]
MRWALAFLMVMPALAAAGTLDDIRARGELRACIAMIDPALVRREPEGCEAECGYAGIVIDQVRAFAATLPDVTLDFVEVTWSSQFADAAGQVDTSSDETPALLANGTCDLYVSNLARLPWREKMMTIVPLFESRMIVLVRADEVSRFSDFDRLAGHSAAVQSESSFHTWLLAANETVFRDNPIRIILSDLDEPLDLVRQGVAEFTLTDADIAVSVMNESAPTLAPALAAGGVQQLGWGMERRASELQAEVAGFFAAQRADPDSALNEAWRASIGVSVAEFEALVRALPDAGQDAHE